MDSPDKNPLLALAMRLTDQSLDQKLNSETLVEILTLLCLISLFQRHTKPSEPEPAQPSPAPTQPGIPKVLTDLLKSTGNSDQGPSPDLMMSLLPLLNSPQVKQKLNPANITSLLGLLQGLGNGNSSNSAPEKNEASTKEASNQPEPPAAALSSAQRQAEGDKGSRYLNWKSSF